MDAGLPPKPSREALVGMCRDSPGKAADFILMLGDKIEELLVTVEKQGASIALLKAKLVKDNPNGPPLPSSDKH